MKPWPVLLLLGVASLTNAAQPVVIAHRGASYDAPENTLASTRLGWAQGADAVETDVRLTKDGKIIVLHDKNTKRTTGRDAEIAQLTFDEARALDAGTWRHPDYAAERLPMLEEQIALIPSGKRMFVELKVGPAIVEELKRTLKHARATEQNVTIISYNYETLREVRKRLPEYRTLYLMRHRKPDQMPADAGRQPTIDEVIAQAKAAGLTGLDLQHTWPLSADDAKRIRDAGLELHVWTVDDPAIARRWIGLGVASITTNRPGWLREQLKF